MTARQIKKYAARVKRRRFFRRLMLLLALCLLLLLAAERNFRPLVLSLAEARSAALASQVLLDAMAESMGDGVGYEERMQRGAAASWQHERRTGERAAWRCDGVVAFCGQRPGYSGVHRAGRVGSDRVCNGV